MYVCRFFFVPIIRIAVQTGFLYVHVFYRDMMHIAYETVYIHVQYLQTNTEQLYIFQLQNKYRNTQNVEKKNNSKKLFMLIVFPNIVINTTSQYFWCATPRLHEFRFHRLYGSYSELSEQV